VDLKQPTYSVPEVSVEELKCGYYEPKEFPFTLAQPVVLNPNDKTYTYSVPIADSAARARRTAELFRKLEYALDHPSDDNDYHAWVRSRSDDQPLDFQTYVRSRLAEL
jgi:hypothetical protein